MTAAIDPKTQTEADKHWLYRKGTARRLWAAGCGILVLVLLSDLAVAPEPHFEIDGTLFFYSWFGFIGCAAFVLLARLLGYLLKRPEDYYRD